MKKRKNILALGISLVGLLSLMSCTSTYNPSDDDNKVVDPEEGNNNGENTDNKEENNGDNTDNTDKKEEENNGGENTDDKKEEENNGGEEEVPEVTKITILGVNSGYVNQSYTLKANVIGGKTKEVTWASSNTAIATVSESGVVTGLTGGTVTITATSVENTSISGSIEFTVILPTSKDLSINVSGSTLDSESSSYPVAIGQQITLSAVTGTNADEIQADYFTYSLLNSDYSSYVSLIDMGDGTATVTGLAESGDLDIDIQLKGAFKEYSSASPLVATIRVSVYNASEENLSKVSEKVSTFKETEINSLSTGSLIKSAKYKDNKGEEVSYSETNEITSYADGSSVTTTNEDGTYTLVNGFLEGSNGNIEKYALKIVDGEVKNYFDKNVYSGDNIANAKKEAALSVFDNSGQPQYGVYSRLSDLLNNESIYESFLGFGKAEALYNAKFTFDTSKYVVDSSFTLNSVNYAVKLELGLDANGEISGYSFSSSFSSDGEYTSKYSEEFSFEASSSKGNNPKDFKSTYTFNKLSAVNIGGKGDDAVTDNEILFKDADHYGVDQETVDENGNKKYLVRYDHTLVVKITDEDNPLATPYVDSCTVTSSDTSIIGTISNDGSGILSINPAEDAQANRATGTATVTIKSSVNSLETSFTVEFYAPKLEEIEVTNVTDNDTSTSDVIDFAPIYVGMKSSYFYLKTEPDSLDYSYSLEILSGDSDGLSLYKYETDVEDLEVSGMAYTLIGEKAGTYQFKITAYAPDDPTESAITQDVYQIVVEEAPSKETILENILGNIYQEDSSLSIKFETETNIVMTHKTSIGEISTVNIAYHVEDGKIIIDDSADNLGYQEFDKSFLIARVRAGEITYSYDFKDIKIPYMYYEKNGDEVSVGNQSYKLHKFTYTKDASDLSNYLNGTSYTTESFVYASSDDNANKYTAVVSFKDGKGTMMFSLKDSDFTATVTFDYVNGSSDATLTLSNVVSDNENVKFGNLEVSAASNYGTNSLYFYDVSVPTYAKDGTLSGLTTTKFIFAIQ